MKKLIALLTFIFAWNVQAARSGTDERIYQCVTDQNAQQLGPNEVFKVHVIRGREMTLTRQSDGKIVKSEGNSSGYYIIYKTEDTEGGYMSNIDENGRLIVAYRLGLGVYANNRLSCTQTQVISEYAPLTKTELALQDIGNNAPLANGQYDFSAFDLKTFDLATEWAKIEKLGNGWEGCSWTRLTDHKEILKMVKEDAGDPDAARKIKRLEREPGLIEMIGYKSDDDISCSQRWVWLYTRDGYKLELEYSQGD